MIVIPIVISLIIIVVSENDTGFGGPNLCYGINRCIDVPNCTNCPMDTSPKHTLPYGARLGMIIGTVFVLLVIVTSIIWCYILSRRISRIGREPIVPPPVNSLILSEYTRSSIQKSMVIIAQQKKGKRQSPWHVPDPEPRPGTSNDPTT